MTQQKVELDAMQQIGNALVAGAFWLRWLSLVQFWLADMGKARNRKWRIPQWPVGIDVRFVSEVPYTAILSLTNIGVASTPGAIYWRVEGGWICREATIYVSPRQHWMADRTLRAKGFSVLSRPVQRRGQDSATSAQSGEWREWGVDAKPRSIDAAIMQMMGWMWGYNTKGKRRS
jgi:hypothetical protein